MKLDRIYDLVTRFFGQPNEKAAENLKEMAEKFFLCGGEFFLAVKRYPESFRRGLNFSGGLMPHCPDETYFLKTEIYLGIIRADEELEIRDGQEVAFRFPIQIPYAVGDILFGKSALWERADIFLMGSFFYDIMLYLKQEIETLEIDKPGLDIAIGDEEVKKLVRQYQNLINKHFGDFPLLQPIVEMSCLLARFLKNFPEQDEFLEKNPEILKKSSGKGLSTTYY